MQAGRGLEGRAAGARVGSPSPSSGSACPLRAPPPALTPGRWVSASSRPLAAHLSI